MRAVGHKVRNIVGALEYTEARRDAALNVSRESVAEVTPQGAGKRQVAVKVECDLALDRIHGHSEDVVIPVDQSIEWPARTLAHHYDISGGVGDNDSPGRHLAERRPREESPDVLLAITCLIIQL